MKIIRRASPLAEAGFDHVFVSPAPGDSGKSLGAALAVWHQNHSSFAKRSLYNYTGREYSYEEVQAVLENAGDKISFRRHNNIEREVAKRLARGEIIAWFQRRSEFGPRALGARSILADPRSKETIKRLNEKVKTRHWFQPIAPSILADRCLDFFTASDSPFMSFAVKARDITKNVAPAIVHEDGTSRIHTVEESENATYYRLISEFEKITAVPIVANTSFNAKGEPIVETPQDALNALYRMHFDGLAIGPFMVLRTDKALHP